LHVDQYLEKLLFKVPTTANIYLLFFPVNFVTISIPKIIVGKLSKGISLIAQGIPPTFAQI